MSKRKNDLISKGKSSPARPAWFENVNDTVGGLNYSFRLGVYDYAFEMLTGVNVDNDADAQFMIGQMYAKGKGVKKDEKKAEEWYWKAANQGLAAAALELEKIIDRETARLKRKQQELIDEIEEIGRKLLEED